MDIMMSLIKALFGRKAKILIIDDNDETASFLAMFLKSKGYRTERASNGVEGLRTAESVSPDLVFLDITMPKMDGKEVLLRMKSNPATQKVPVIMCTDHSALDEVEECCRLGAVGYILKPFETAKVLHTVKSMLESRGL